MTSTAGQKLQCLHSAGYSCCVHPQPVATQRHPTRLHEAHVLVSISGRRSQPCRSAQGASADAVAINNPTVSYVATAPLRLLLGNNWVKALPLALLFTASTFNYTVLMVCVCMAM